MCNSTVNLNTNLKVKIEGIEYEICICDDHSEDVTFKKAKELVVNKIKEFEELKKKMAEFGVNVTGHSEGGIILAGKQPTKQVINEGSEVVPVKLAQERSQPQSGVPVKLAQARSQPQSGSRKTLDTYNIPDPDISNTRGQAKVYKKLDSANMINNEVEAARARGEEVNVPEVAEVVEQVVERANGSPMRLPKQIKGKDGSSTNIVITKTSHDDIMKRTHQLSRDDGHSFVTSYGLKNCPLCNATGRLRVNNQVCSKCEGAGFIK